MFNAMDLPIQALRVDAKRVNIRNLSVILSAFVCLLPYIEGLISLGSADQKASVLYDTRDLASTHFWRKKPCNCSLTRPRHQTSASQLLRLLLFIPGHGPENPSATRRSSLLVERQAGGILVSFNLCYLSLLWRLEFKS